MPRPSSPLSAKASTKCPYALDPKPQPRTQRASPPRPSPEPRFSTTQHSCFTRLATPARPHTPRVPKKTPETADNRPQPVAFLFTMPNSRGQRTENRGQILCTSTSPYLIPSRGTKKTSASHRRRPSVLRPLSSGPAPGGAGLSKRPSAPGGADRDRTGDLLLAKQALSQLSYTPLPETRDQDTEIRI